MYVRTHAQKNPYEYSQKYQNYKSLQPHSLADIYTTCIHTCTHNTSTPTYRYMYIHNA